MEGWGGQHPAAHLHYTSFQVHMAEQPDMHQVGIELEPIELSAEIPNTVEQ